MGDVEHTFAAPKGILALEVRHENYWLVIPGRPLDGYGQNQSRTCCSLIHFTHSLLQPGTAASFLLWGFHEISTPPQAVLWWVPVGVCGTWILEVEELPTGILTQERNWDQACPLQSLPSCPLRCQVHLDARF